MTEYSALNLKEAIPDFPPEQKRLILKEGPMRLVEKQVKVRELHLVFYSNVVLAK